MGPRVGWARWGPSSKRSSKRLVGETDGWLGLLLRRFAVGRRADLLGLVLEIWSEPSGCALLIGIGLVCLGLMRVWIHVPGCTRDGAWRTAAATPQGWSLLRGPTATFWES